MLAIGLSGAVGLEVYERSYSLHSQNVSRASLASLEVLEGIAVEYGIGDLELSFPPLPGRVGELNEAVGRKVGQLAQDFAVTIHLPRVSIDTLEGFAEIIAGLGFARQYGGRNIKQVVVHPCEAKKKNGWLKRKQPSDPSVIKQEGIRSLRELISACDREMVLGIENMPGNASWGKDPSDFLSLFKKKNGGPVVGFCLDTAHCYNAGKDSLKKIALFKSHLTEVHLNDTKIRNGLDEHCALGEGRVDLASVVELLEEINFTGPGIMEVFRKDFETSWKWLEEHGLV